MITTYVQGGDEQDINKARLVIPVKAHNDSLKYQSAYDEESSLIKIQRGSNMAKPIGDFTVDEKSRKVFHKGKECKEEKNIKIILEDLNDKGIKDIVYDAGHVYLITGSGWVYIPGYGWFKVP